MVLHFNVKGESRKAMVKAIEKVTGVKAKYLGVPSCAYQIGAYRVEKDGTLSFLGDAGIDESAKVIDECVMATGVSPAEWDEVEEETQTEVCVNIPTDKVNAENLKSLLDFKGDLIKKALGIESLNFEVTDEYVRFDWIKGIEPEHIQAYTKFISAICELTIKQKRINTQKKENEDEKYAFRCFLLRLGFIGNEYKADRKILLSKLEGCSSKKGGIRKDGEQ